jgi:hypothetical protein
LSVYHSFYLAVFLNFVASNGVFHGLAIVHKPYSQLIAVSTTCLCAFGEARSKFAVLFVRF